MPVFMVMLGAPGVGKGTQAELLSSILGLPHVSSGDIFRENITHETELGKLAANYMNRGELVPDDVTISMIGERLSRPDCAAGALLDGYPRTAPQAESLDKLLAGMGTKVQVVPYIRVPEAELVERLAGRWTCRKSGHIYHQKFNPPRQPGICDVDGSELYQRQDDAPETVKNRIRVYLEQTAPLVEYYRKTGALVEIDGNQPIEDVTNDLLAIMPEIN